MFYNNKTIIIILAVIITISLKCTTLNAKNTFYTEAEQALLEKTLSALDYDYGYDYRMESPYIYSYSYSKDNFDKKEKAFADIINNYDYKTVLDLYKKIMKVQAIMDYKMDWYKKETKWKYYTFIKDDLLEPVNSYSSLLLKYILKKNASLGNILEMEKKSITVDVVKTYTDKDEIVDTF